MTAPDIRALIRRRARGRHRDLLLAALDHGLRMKPTKSGVRILAPDGRTAGTHFTPSDHRATSALRADLARLGVPV